MAGTLLFCCLLAIHLSHASQQKDNKPQDPDAGPAGAAVALSSGGRMVREEELLQAVNFVKQGDTRIKEQLEDSYTDLKEQLKEGDARLKERVVEGLAQLKEQLKEGDSRMKEELDEDVAWLKGKIDRVEENMADQMSEQRDAVKKLKDEGDRARQEMDSALMINDLKKEMRDMQEELVNATTELQNTRAELADAKRILQARLDSTEHLLQTTNQRQDGSQQALQDLQENVRNLTWKLEAGSPSGSTFTRWGSSSCPHDTTLVYSGFAGGSWWNYEGGASNYLCLVTNPRLDNDTGVPSKVNYLHGAEYEELPEDDDQDVVCSVCRVPRAATTIMIPATVDCPAGWAAQFRGMLMSGRSSHKGKTEYVCVDEVREHRPGGHASKDGVLFYPVVTSCGGSLPCPPYVGGKIVTCVVCSL